MRQNKKTKKLIDKSILQRQKNKSLAI